MKYTFIFLLFILISCQSTDQHPQIANSFDGIKETDFNKIKSLTDLFFKKYKDEGTSKAIDYIFGLNINHLQPDPKSLISLKSKLDSTRESIGNFYGQELITERSTSNSFVLVSYLIKHQKQPIRFTFIFYKPLDTGILFKFTYDDQVESELEDSGKIYYIK